MSMIATRKQILLGTNQYPNLQEKMFDKIAKENVKEEDIQAGLFKKLLKSRGAEEFERLRLQTEEYVLKGGKLPRVFLLTIGNLNMRIARAMFISNFFGCAGYEIINNNGFDDIESGFNKAMEMNSDIIVLCSSDEEYINYAPTLAEYAKAHKFSGKLIVAGNPVEIIDSLKQSGIDDFISIKSNVLETLKKYNNILLS
jgi:methylmalonyl-CoA mutase